ncbi:MAG TPA: hypothetical protein VN031_03745 [Candidatus Microsaccharimonas sp.]|nr:hypothetical protein [Candidatus Microsaccharimonas sp.]
MAESKMVGLPVAVSSPVDLGRLIRELEAIDNALNQNAIRTNQTATALPKMSELLTQTVELNKLNLLQTTDRTLLMQFLVSVRERAPRLHMSFSADPSPQFSEKLTSYLREQIHPLALVTFGLQPNIGAGCVLRTTNKYFDFSLGAALNQKRDVVMQTLREAIAQPLATDPPVPAQPQPQGVAA